ncbi:MAG: hypothetical protein LBM93_11670 [Oscillospiraceae bacterium]|nr:hypothetical protein [Oscillospiraceae bacterium]
MKYISACTDRMILLADSVKERQITVSRKELFEWVRNGEEIYGVNAEKELIYSLHSLAPIGRKVRKSDLVYAGEKLKKDYKHYLLICTTRGTGGKWYNYFIGDNKYQKGYMATVYYIDTETNLLKKDTGGELYVPMPKHGTNKREDFIVKFKDKPELRIANNDADALAALFQYQLGICENEVLFMHTPLH